MKPIRKIIREYVEQAMNYGLFYDFLTTEFGVNPTKNETADTIIQWSNLWAEGLNEGDFEGVSEYMDDEIYDFLINNNINFDYLDKLKEYTKKERNI